MNNFYNFKIYKPRNKLNSKHYLSSYSKLITISKKKCNNFKKNIDQIGENKFFFKNNNDLSFNSKAKINIIKKNGIPKKNLSEKFYRHKKNEFYFHSEIHKNIFTFILFK